jgi:beta-glucanase (GH16 family)
MMSRHGLFAGIALICAGVAWLPASTAQAAGAGWRMTWHDEFDGAGVDPTKWLFENGTQEPGGPSNWGNNELEYYTNRSNNVYISNGSLHIRAQKEEFGGMHYTSARMKTKGLFSQTYGRFEWGATLPLGQGLWPALWMMPQSNAYGGWAASGEIDVLEAKGQISNAVQGTIVHGGAWPNQKYSTLIYTLPSGQTINQSHEYALEWTPTSIKWFVDGYCYETQTSWSTTNTAGTLNAPYPAPFDQPFYLIMNLAVGGDSVGSPNGTTPFPSEMVVDYVRVYEAPEPGTLGLLVLGGLAVARRWRRAGRRSGTQGPMPRPPARHQGPSRFAMDFRASRR